MIYFFSPYSFEKNIGKAYNEYFNLVQDDDWVVLFDGDTMFLQSNYGEIIQEYIYAYPDVGLFSCRTNRVGNVAQLHNGLFSEDSDIKNHREIAKNTYINNRLKLTQVKKVISGMFFAVKKSTWRSVGGFPEDGMMGVDNRFSFRVMKSGRSVMLMDALYIFHYYRLCEGGKSYKNHLI